MWKNICFYAITYDADWIIYDIILSYVLCNIISYDIVILSIDIIIYDFAVKTYEINKSYDRP